MSNPIERAGHYVGRAGHWTKWGGGQAANVARRGGQDAIHAVGDLGKRGFTTLGGFFGPPGIAITQGVVHWRVSVYIIASIILFLLFLFMATSDDSQNNNQTTDPLQVTKQGPTQGTKGQTLNYIINVSYPGTATSLIISDPLPNGTTYVSSSPNGTLNGNVLTWDSKDYPSFLKNAVIDVTVSFTLLATEDNNYAINYATAALTGGSVTGAVTNGDVAANQSTCGGKYTLANPYANFGDPQCNYTQQGMDTEIKQLDPTNALTWDCIAKHESSPPYNPNSYLKASTSGKGAFGLFQMNPKGQGNGQYDAGNVNWPLQTSNAINYRNKVINGSWAYWQTYSEYCS